MRGLMSKKKKSSTRRFSKKERTELNTLLWQVQCDLQADDYIIYYSEPRTNKKSDSGWDYLVSAEITVRPKYLKADIKIFPCLRKMFRKDFASFEKVLYHEVAHIIIDPLYLDQCDELSPLEKVYYNEKREQAVEKVGRIGRWARQIRDEMDALNTKEKSKGGD